MRNVMVQDRIKRERARFIESLDKAAILKLASSYHKNAPCKFFKPLKHGGFNVCFFVEFDLPGCNAKKPRWVVRIPIPGRNPVAWIDEKLEVEVATMRHVALNTKIPVPKVHAYSFSGQSPIGMAFIIMDFVDGQNLREHGFKQGDKWNNWRGPTEATKLVYQQLAEVLIELRKQEFPAIGALGIDPCGPSKSNLAGVRVCHRPLSIEIAMQESEGQNPSEMFPARKTFSTASEYIQSLLWLLDNELNRCSNPDIDRAADRGKMLLYAARDFRRFVTQKWLDASKENGPFVLMHGVLHNHYSNLLWDEDLKLVGVIDWEWSHVVPVQLFTPPVWLDNATVESVCLFQGLFKDELGYLHQEISNAEAARGEPHTLSIEWEMMQTWSHSLVVSSLFRPNDMYDVYWDFMSQDIFKTDAHQDKSEVQVKAVLAWVAGSETAQAWLKEKAIIQDKYYEQVDKYKLLEDIKDKTK
ncbi:hypothetical protein Daus18300_014066 [Diaporthe australafricana]|uniref:Aminoglycoside phosphotransferase domain-containing protein n=1 Tax=Diaporthe australafricana TaxID=127596 RepID=A0ABR3VWS3_9PEZI